MLYSVDFVTWIPTTGYRRRMVASWDGHAHRIRRVLIVNRHTMGTTFDSGHYMGPGTWACFDVQSEEIIYVSYSALFTSKLSSKLSYRLYNVAQRVDQERKALKQAFAQYCANKLNRDVIEIIFRFC